MAIPRPYGRGPYGAGPYSRYRGAIYECGGATGIAFSVRSLGVNLVWLPWALTGIAWTVYTMARFYHAWARTAPCSTGTWGDPGTCLPATWVPPPAGIPGTWTPKDLT